MLPISSDLSSILHLDQFSMQVTGPQLTPVSGDISQNLLDDIATSSIVNPDQMLPFDMAMNDIASYKDLISSAQNGISQMKSQGQSIQDIIAQAQQGGLSQELIDKMQAEVNEKIMDISIIKDAAESENGNPYDGACSIDIPDMQALMGVDGNSIYSAVSGGMTSYDMDINLDFNGVSFEGTAKIAMGVGDDGRFQFAFDVSLDYDLSGITGDGGITSPDATSIINNFMNMLNSHENTLGKADSLIDKVFEKIFENVNATQPAPGNNVQNYNSSSIISQQIVQQSTSVLDSIMLNQMPNMALSLI